MFLIFSCLDIFKFTLVLGFFSCLDDRRYFRVVSTFGLYVFRADIFHCWHEMKDGDFVEILLG